LIDTAIGHFAWPLMAIDITPLRHLLITLPPLLFRHCCILLAVFSLAIILRLAGQFIIEGHCSLISGIAISDS